jgi:hypothetical protein
MAIRTGAGKTVRGAGRKEIEAGLVFRGRANWRPGRVFHQVDNCVSGRSDDRRYKVVMRA